MYAELCACLFLFVCVCSHALPGDPVCQNNRSCYGGSCDCGSLYNGTYCENGASRNPVILDISCMSLLWRVCMHMHVCPFPPQLLVYRVGTSTASMVALVSVEHVNVWAHTLGHTASTETVSWSSASATTKCIQMAPCTMHIPLFPGDSPCQNGRCVSGEFYAYCACDYGYTGYNCETSKSSTRLVLCAKGASMDGLFN